MEQTFSELMDELKNLNIDNWGEVADFVEIVTDSMPYMPSHDHDGSSFVVSARIQPEVFRAIDELTHQLRCESHTDIVRSALVTGIIILNLGLELKKCGLAPLCVADAGVYGKGYELENVDKGAELRIGTLVTGDIHKLGESLGHKSIWQTISVILTEGIKAVEKKD